MGLGGCIILIAVGAILTFATDWQMQGSISTWSASFSWSSG